MKKIITAKTRNLERAAQVLAPREHKFLLFLFRVFILSCFRGKSNFPLFPAGLSGFGGLVAL
jgi:hypothetical protein